MITISKITDHAAIAVGRLASQFKEKIKISGLVTVLANEAQAVENAFWDLLLANRDFTVATGATLDNIGDLVGAPERGLRNDTVYRNRIAGQVAINRSSGESRSIYAIAKGLVSAWNVPSQPRIFETGVCEYVIRCDGPTALADDLTQAQELAHVLDDASSAGVRAIVISRPSSRVGSRFRFAGSGGGGFGQGGFIAAYDK